MDEHEIPINKNLGYLVSITLQKKRDINEDNINNIKGEWLKINRI